MAPKNRCRALQSPKNGISVSGCPSILPIHAQYGPKSRQTTESCSSDLSGLLPGIPLLITEGYPVNCPDRKFPGFPSIIRGCRAALGIITTSPKSVCTMYIPCISKHTRAGQHSWKFWRFTSLMEAYITDGDRVYIIDEIW